MVELTRAKKVISLKLKSSVNTYLNSRSRLINNRSGRRCFIEPDKEKKFDGIKIVGELRSEEARFRGNRSSFRFNLKMQSYVMLGASQMRPGIFFFFFFFFARRTFILIFLVLLLLLLLFPLLLLPLAVSILPTSRGFFTSL